MSAIKNLTLVNNNFIIKILDCMSEVQEKLDSGEWDFGFSKIEHKKELV